MIKNINSGQKPQKRTSWRPGKTYLHSLVLRQWILRKEQSFEIFEAKNNQYGISD